MEWVTVGAFSQAGAVGLAPPVRRRSGPLGGQEATRSERPWGLLTKPVPRIWLRQSEGAAAPSGGQEATRSGGPWGLLTKPAPRIWLRQSEGVAAPSGGRKLHAVSDRGGF